MTDNYILDGKTPVPCDDFMAWSEWFPTADREVAKTVIGCVAVCTEFLAVVHRFELKNPPLLFETMTYGGPLDFTGIRYATWEEAERGHAEMVERVKKAAG